MDYSSLGNRFKRNSQEATLDDLEYQMASLGREEPLLSEITEHKDILSANAINSYLNPSGNAPTEGFNEQIGMVEKAILEEKNCPNILQFQTELYANLSEIVDNQDQGIKDAKQTLENKIFLNIYALEVERIKYLLKSYLRIRLFKIEKFATYIIRNKLEGLLSRQEAIFLKQFFEVKQQHFKTNLLNHLPSQFRSLGLDPKYETINNEFMVQEPDLEKAVIVRVVRRFEKLNLDIANSQEMDLMPGEIYCFKYKDIKNLHEMGVVEFV